MYSGDKSSYTAEVLNTFFGDYLDNNGFKDSINSSEDCPDGFCGLDDEKDGKGPDYEALASFWDNMPVDRSDSYQRQKPSYDGIGGYFQ